MFILLSANASNFDIAKLLTSDNALRLSMHNRNATVCIVTFEMNILHCILFCRCFHKQELPLRISFPLLITLWYDNLICTFSANSAGSNVRVHRNTVASPITLSKCSQRNSGSNQYSALHVSVCLSVCLPPQR